MLVAGVDEPDATTAEVLRHRRFVVRGVDGGFCRSLRCGVNPGLLLLGQRVISLPIDAKNEYLRPQDDVGGHVRCVRAETVPLILGDVEFGAAERPVMDRVDPFASEVDGVSSEGTDRLALDGRVEGAERDPLPIVGPEQRCLCRERPAQRAHRKAEANDAGSIQPGEKLVRDGRRHQRLHGRIARDRHRCLDGPESVDPAIGE